MNTVTVSQKAKTCGEIRFHFKVTNTTIGFTILARAERELRRNPDHQQSYYDILLVDSKGKELDFQTNIL